jgi:hypothetical protein
MRHSETGAKSKTYLLEYAYRQEGLNDRDPVFVQHIYCGRRPTVSFLFENDQHYHQPIIEYELLVDTCEVAMLHLVCPDIENDPERSTV